MSDGNSVVKTGAEITDDLYGNNGVGYVTVSSSWIVDDAWYKAGDSNTADLTFTAGSYWTDVATPTPTASYNFRLSTVENATVTGTASADLTPYYYYDGNWTVPYIDSVDASNLTVTAVLTRGTTHVASSNDYQVDTTYATLPELYNPNNLGTGTLSCDITDWYEDVTIEDAITAVLHKAADTDEVPSDAEAFFYWDHLADWYNSTTNQSMLVSPVEILQSGAQQGDLILGIFNDSDYTNDTTVDMTALGGYIGTYGVISEYSGTPNTAGYKPTTGYQSHGSLNTTYVSFHVDGQHAVSTKGVVHVIVGPAVANIAAGVGYKKTDVDTTSPLYRHYTATLVPDGS